MAYYGACPRCGGTMTPVSERQGGFSGGKAVVGGVLLGPVGLLAGALGKKKVLYCCKACGYTLEK